MIGGDLRTKPVKLQTTDTAIFTSNKERRQILGIWLCNTTAGAITATVKVTRSAVEYELISSKSIAANDYLFIGNQGNGPIWAMSNGDILEGNCSTNDAIHCHVVYTTLGTAGT